MKIAVWYHCVLSGPRIPSEDHAVLILAEQMRALKESGLSAASSANHIGINGTESDALLALSFAPSSFLPHIHGPAASSELSTLKVLQSWLPDHPGWFVFYHQIKGVTHPGEASYENWRRRMEHACVWNWRQCVADLERGYEAVGCHWLTPEKFPGAVTSPFFGGTFWWAKSEYLMQLPPLPEDTHGNRYEAESWIGRRRPYPVVRDYHPGWP